MSLAGGRAVLQHVDRAGPGLDLVRRPQRGIPVSEIGPEPRRLHPVGGQLPDHARATAPDAWRRHLALLLDGLRPGAAHPLPVPPLTSLNLS